MVLCGYNVLPINRTEREMTPTARLRFVERNEPVVLRGERFDNWRKVLQQWWVDDSIDGQWVHGSPEKGEWRDVPMEKEQ